MQRLISSLGHMLLQIRIDNALSQPRMLACSLQAILTMQNSTQQQQQHAAGLLDRLSELHNDVYQPLYITQHVRSFSSQTHSKINAHRGNNSSSSSSGSSSSSRKGSRSRRDDVHDLPMPSSITWPQYGDQQQHLQRLQQQQRSGALQQQQLLQGIPEGELMALIAAARSVRDIEQLVLQHHASFRYNHMAAAVQKLPTLDMGSSLNTRKRFHHLVSLLVSGLDNVSRLLDPHQATGCLAALTSPRCLPPLRHTTLQRLLLLLLSGGNAAVMRELHSYELAQCAAAAAAMQDAMQQEQQRQQSRQQQQQQQEEVPVLEHLGEDLTSPDLPVPFSAVASNQDSSSSSSNALALQEPLQRFWQQLSNVITPQLSTFSADSLALTALSFAAAGQSSRELMLGVVNAALARPQKFMESPVAVSRMLKALLITGINHEGLLSVLAAAVAANATKRDHFTPSQLSDAAAASAAFSFYHEPALQAISKTATRSLKYWPKNDIITLLTSLESLRFRDEPFMATAVKHLTAAAEGGRTERGGTAGGRGVQQLSAEELAASLAALLQLGFSGQSLEGLLAATMRHISKTLSDTSAKTLPPSATTQLLWAMALLEQPAASIPSAASMLPDASILPLLLAGLQGVEPQELSQQDLRLLYQAHRLLDKGWVLAGNAESAGNASAAGWESQQQWPQQLFVAAQEAAAVYAASSASRGKRHVQAVQTAFEDLGYEAPIRDLRVDGGALLPDLAFVADSSSSSSGGGGGDSSIKVALMCDHAGRFSRNAPFELLGYWRVVGWLLEADGWKVVRLPGHEWKMIMDDKLAHESSAMAYVYNTLSAQGVVL